MDDASHAVLHVDRHELEALASMAVSVDEQTRLDSLNSKAKSSDLTAEESAELDRLLDRIDRLNLLKAKALASLAAPGDATWVARYR